jgi:hypothetical protein
MRMRRSEGRGTYEALLHPLSDFTNPNESHILPHSWILIGTWGLRMIRIDPYYQLSSYLSPSTPKTCPPKSGSRRIVERGHT